MSKAKLAAVWTYASSPMFDAKERAALDFALAAAQQPNAMTDDVFAATQVHWSDAQIVEILGVVAMFGFLNRWSDTMATPLEPAPHAVATQALGNSLSAGKHVVCAFLRGFRAVTQVNTAQAAMKLIVR